MSFHNVPPNGFPDLPDVEELEAVVKDVTGLKADKAAKADIAPAFSATSNYAVGDMVYHDGTLYVCSTAHAAAAWDANHFTAASVASELSGVVGDIGDLTSTKANQITIAPFFNPEASYEAGDLVYYNGLSYRCTNDHEGAWDAADFAATTIAGEIASVKSGLTGYLNTRNATSAVIASIVPGANIIPVNFATNIPSGMKPRFIGYNGNDKTLNVVAVNAIQPLGDNDTQANIIVYNPTQDTYTDVTVYACLGLVKV